MSTQIYGLFDPRSQELRYVGRTGRTLFERLLRHLSDSVRVKSSPRCAAWIMDLVNQPTRLYPEIDLIEEVEDDRADEAERFWIGYFRMIGANLLNVTHGGPGISGYRHTVATRKLISDSLIGNTRSAGKPNRLGRPNSPEVIALVAAKRRGFTMPLEQRQKIANSNLGRRRSPETCAKISAVKTAWWAARRVAV